jgi:ABC-type Fe3+-hydroxamate transport system substrate-binding protein
MGNNGNGHKRTLVFERPPQRVVSLVPSVTESLFDLGFGASVVGITDYCTQPAAGVQGLKRVGGPRTPRLDEILALQPELVLANQEENTQADVEALEAAGLSVWVTFPRSVHGALEVLWSLVGLYQSTQAATRLQTLELSLEWNEAALEGQPPRRCFCPIWHERLALAEGGDLPWWMTFNQATYAGDLLRMLGAQNIFAERKRRYPLATDLGLPEGAAPAALETGQDTRYPRVTLDEIRAADPEVILLPSEPFGFDAAHQAALQRWLPETSAVRQGRVYLVDGSLITWHGTRLAHALQQLPALLAG